MKPQRWRERTLDSTRGRIFALLRVQSCTVNELAAALKLTDNAVRAHLISLERDGLIQREGSRPVFESRTRRMGLRPTPSRFFRKHMDCCLIILCRASPGGSVRGNFGRACARSVDLWRKNMAISSRRRAETNDCWPPLIC